MRTALQLLLLLAVAAVPGSLLPQEPVDPAAVAGFVSRHEDAGPALERLGLFDVYASAWFSSIYLLLLVSLVGCVLPRLRRYWRSVRSAPPPAPRNLSRLAGYRRVTITHPGTASVRMPGGEVSGSVSLTAAATLPAPASAPTSTALLTRARDVLIGHGYRVRMAEADGSLAAERGYLAEAGNLLFHLSLLGVLLAVVLGAFFGWSGQVILAEGQTFADVPTGYDSLRLGRLIGAGDLPAFAVTLRGMSVRFAKSGPERGAPRQFLADLAVQDGESVNRPFRLAVNHPLRVAGAKVYLVGNGYAPRVTVWDSRGSVVFAGTVPFLPRDGQYTSVGAIKVPDARPSQLGFAGLLLPTAEFDPARGPISTYPDLTRPRLVLTAYTGDLGLDSGLPQSVYALQTSRMTQLRTPDGSGLRLLLAPGTVAELPGGGRIRLDKVGRYAALDVRRDPGKGVALISASTALAGLIVSLLLRRRRIWVRVRPAPEGTVVEAAGLARGNDPSLDARVADLLARICSDGLPAAAVRAAVSAPQG
ncbi:MAG: cytochrome c biogenesis protein ResB [Actinobacteria bacterium]|nr:cytochrome c biogenesis protein ResB [Actinomycetota bacterium]